MYRRRGPSVRLRLALSYAAVVIVTGTLLLGVVWVFLLRYVPDQQIPTTSGHVPTRGDLVQAFTPSAEAVFLLLLVFGLVGGWLLAGRMLAPLDRLTEVARQASAGSLDHRVDLPGRNDEFRVLADVFDTMLAELQAHITSQQRFAANASHELRTPLAISRTLLEVARDDPAHDQDALVQHLLTVNERATELVEALLVLSRTNQRSFVPALVDLSLVAEEAAETLLPVAEARAVAIEVVGDVTHATGSSTLLLQVATNLVQNAVVHNIEHGSIRVHTAEQPNGRAVLVVENTGRVVSADEATTFIEPFQRGDSRVRGNHPGIGLGLAIVDAIVRAHDGTLGIVPRDGGGLRVTVELPGVDVP